jgi:nucleoside-diphosphate-sugar epimerase
MKRVLVTGGSGFIGTHLVSKIEHIADVFNLDIRAPNISSHAAYWRCVDIMDTVALNAAFRSYRPDCVVHLAARTDTESGNVDDYRVNTVGTENVLRAAISSASVQRFVHTSTQFVNQYHGMPKSDTDYAPHTAYGQSKVISEQSIRAGATDLLWTIIRPTNIWGAWHKRYPHEFWRVLAQGLYLHPGSTPVVRSYGYVENVVDQVLAILMAQPSRISQRVFYVGDEPLDVFLWANEFSMQITGQGVKRVPVPLIRGLAILGDGVKKFGGRFPITTSRFKSMTNSNYVDMSSTFELCGKPAVNLEVGVSRTVGWLKDTHPDLFRRG